MVLHHIPANTCEGAKTLRQDTLPPLHRLGHRTGHWIVTARENNHLDRDPIATILDTIDAIGGAIGVDRGGFLVLHDVPADIATLVDQMHDEIAAYIIARASHSRSRRAG
jgi:hypothetical protein